MSEQDPGAGRQATPLLDALLGQEGRVSFHMPGHREGRIFPPLDQASLLSLDTTELSTTGDLSEPHAHVQEAYQLAARFFGAGRTWFITSGTTTSIFIMLASVLGPGDKIILPRAVHLAAVHAVALLDLDPVFVKAPQGRTFPDGQPDEEAFLAALNQHPDARALLVTRPDYYGRVVSLDKLAPACRRLRTALLVDEAHGAHWVAAPGFLPATALSLGASLSCQSGHKTLPALTPSSLLHISQGALEEGLVDPDRLARMVKVFQTSSPSFLIAASLDWARADLARRGKEALLRLIELNRDLADRLPPSYRRFLPPGADPSRLVLDYSRTGLSREAFAAGLDREGVDPELVDRTRLVLIPGLDQTEEDYRRLYQLLLSLDREGEKSGLEARLEDLKREAEDLDAFLSEGPRFHMSPREALFGGKKEGGPLLARAALAPYPPGLPLIWPGEEIRPGDLAYLEKLKGQGIHVRGMGQATL